MWSREMLVMTVISGSTVEVASRRPPSPTSSTAQSARRAAKWNSEARKRVSKKVGGLAMALRRQEAGGEVAHGADSAGELRPGDQPAVELDPFSDVLQVRRGEQPHPQPGAAQYGGDVMGGRPLAVGAGHLDVLDGAGGERRVVDEALDVRQGKLEILPLGFF